MPVNPAHFGSFTYMDHTGEKSSMQFNFGAITVASLPGFLTQFGTLRDKTDALTLGTLVADQWVGDRTIYSNIRPSDRNAQRERKFLVIYEDTSTRARYRIEIPTADYSLVEFAPQGDNIIIPDSGPLKEWIDAFEALAKSPEGNTVSVIAVKGVGRNI